MPAVGHSSGNPSKDHPDMTARLQPIRPYRLSATRKPKGMV